MSELEAGAPATNGDGSHLAWLRKRHQELEADRHLDLEVPGYYGRLVIRCGPVPWATVARVQNLVGRQDREGRGLLAAQTDTLVAACREVLVRPQEDGPLEGVDPSGEPRRIDPELAQLLGAPAGSARETLLWLYPSEVALAVAAGELLEWTRSMTTETADELVGE